MIRYNRKLCQNKENKLMTPNNQHQGSLVQFETDAEFAVPSANRMKNEQSSLHRDKPRIKTYLQGF